MVIELLRGLSPLASHLGRWVASHAHARTQTGGNGMLRLEADRPFLAVVFLVVKKRSCWRSFCVDTRFLHCFKCSLVNGNNFLNYKWLLMRPFRQGRDSAPSMHCRVSRTLEIGVSSVEFAL